MPRGERTRFGMESITDSIKSYSCLLLLQIRLTTALHHLLDTTPCACASYQLRRRYYLLCSSAQMTLHPIFHRRCPLLIVVRTVVFTVRHVVWLAKEGCAIRINCNRDASLFRARTFPPHGAALTVTCALPSQRITLISMLECPHLPRCSDGGSMSGERNRPSPSVVRASLRALVRHQRPCQFTDMPQFIQRPPVHEALRRRPSDRLHRG